MYLLVHVKLEVVGVMYVLFPLAGSFVGRIWFKTAHTESSTVEPLYRFVVNVLFLIARCP